MSASIAAALAEAQAENRRMAGRIAALEAALERLLRHFNDRGLHVARIDLPAGSQFEAVADAHALLEARAND